MELTWSSLPDEVWILILGASSVPDIAHRICLVSHYFLDLTHDETLWEHLVKREYNLEKVEETWKETYITAAGFYWIDGVWDEHWADVHYQKSVVGRFQSGVAAAWKNGFPTVEGRKLLRWDCRGGGSDWSFTFFVEKVSSQYVHEENLQLCDLIEKGDLLACYVLRHHDREWFYGFLNRNEIPDKTGLPYNRLNIDYMDLRSLCRKSHQSHDGRSGPASYNEGSDTEQDAQWQYVPRSKVPAIVDMPTTSHPFPQMSFP